MKEERWEKDLIDMIAECLIQGLHSLGGAHTL